MSDYVNSTEVITIDQVTKYGGKVNGKSYNLGKKYTGPALEAGITYEVQVSTSPMGAKYLNTAKAITAVAAKTETRTTNNAIQAVEQPQANFNPARVNGSSLSPSEKDTRILVQGILQAVIQAPALVNSENFISDVKTHTTELVEFVRNFK